MICKSCGKEIEDWNYTCPFCGANTQSVESTNKTTGDTTSDTTSNGQSEQKAKKVKTIPNYFVSDDEVEIIRAKWTIIPFVFVWIVYFIILFAGKTAYFTKMKSMQIGINDAVINFLYLLLIVISILICLISIILFLLRRELVVTNKKIYGRLGLIGTKQFIIPIKKINYISVRYSIIDRIFNSATIYVVPGTIFGIWFRFVSNARQFKNELEKLIYDMQ